MVAETHSHWAVGWVQGFSIRVVKKGQITRAFRKYHELAQRLADYPVLDESDYSRREYEDTLSNLADAAWRLRNQYDLPDGWEPLVYDWFSDHDCSAIENVDDRGGYPSQDELRAAFEPWAIANPPCARRSPKVVTVQWVVEDATTTNQRKIWNNGNGHQPCDEQHHDQ